MSSKLYTYIGPYLEFVDSPNTNLGYNLWPVHQSKIWIASSSKMGIHTDVEKREESIQMCVHFTKYEIDLFKDVYKNEIEKARKIGDFAIRWGVVTYWW